MKSTELLRAIYNDKEVLKKIRKSIDEYAINQKSMDQLKSDSKEIEKYVKETYHITPTMFKKIFKATLTVNDNVDEIIDEMQLIRDIAKEQ
jgi:acetyl-CoA carboxylase carboxyltransferase component